MELRLYVLLHLLLFSCLTWCGSRLPSSLPCLLSYYLSVCHKFPLVPIILIFTLKVIIIVYVISQIYRDLSLLPSVQPPTEQFYQKSGQNKRAAEAALKEGEYEKRKQFSPKGFVPFDDYTLLLYCDEIVTI